MPSTSLFQNSVKELKNIAAIVVSASAFVSALSLQDGDELALKPLKPCDYYIYHPL
jgi:hypothetical protein